MIRIQLYQPTHYRDVLSFFLSNMDDLHVVGSLDKHISVEKHLHITQPDVVLLDTAMDDGILLIQRIKKYDPLVKIIVFTEEVSLTQVMNSVRNGADGYLLSQKTSLPTVAECIKIVHEGGFPMTPSLMGEVLKVFLPAQITQPEETIRMKLTKRENEILQLLVEGLTYKAVSFHLNIAIDTVRSHIKRIYGKLEVNSKSEAVVKALKQNSFLIPL
jgi:DNA-binding NarL/FixJ family response regulator